ncbi:DUF4142 domain-containing protein [Streptomyces sp. NPDC005728]|uniref:DUF4142 domain-containing protein n=1 Tax=Streptomyces sp. NPDC005728 TaxID=3157054 RepID=UPI0033FB5F7C
MTTAANPLPSADQDFVHNTTALHSIQIDAAKLAKQNTDDEDVQAFAKRVITDSIRLFMQLKAVAPHRVTVPKANHHSELLNSLRPLSGTEFDHAYVSTFGLELLERGIAAYETEVVDGEDPSLKNAAQNALPTLREHHSMGRKLAQKMGIAK